MGALTNSPSCAGGVDNQWLEIVDGIQSATPHGNIHTELLDQISHGQHTYLIRISDVNDLTNDSMVRVSLWEGYPQFVDCDAMFSGVAEFSVASWSLTPGGAGIEADARFSQLGRIDAGRLIVAPGARGESVHLPLPLYWARNTAHDLRGYALHDVQIRLTLSVDGASASDGVIGGWFSGDELIPTCLGCEDAVSFAMSFVARVVDIHLPGSAVCVDRSTPGAPRFGGISAAVGFTAVRAVIRPQPASDRTPGMCGSSVAQSDGGG